MNKAAFYTLGCRVNQYETQAMKELLAKNGFEICNFNEKAEIYIINSCTVTATGDKKSRQALHKAKKLNKDCITILTGCYAQKMSLQQASEIGADIVVGNDSKDKIMDIINEYAQSKKLYWVNSLNKDTLYDDLNLESYEEKTRGMIKIEDGCDRFCSYCIIPYVRGPIRCRPFDKIIAEGRALSENGFKEVVITGIQTAAYKWENYDLGDVVREIAKIDGIERIRLGSLEPVIITDKFLNILLECGKFCPTFHLSLQSGCDSILKLMNRRYTTKEYKEKIDKIREYFPLAGITTDVITGFPGETEENHKESMVFAESIGFAHMHVFPFSPRENTKAALMDGQLDKKVKEDRCKEFNKLSAKLHKEFLSANIGKTYPVLFEQITKDGKYEGLTPNYITVKINSTTDLCGKIKNVEITKEII